MDLIVKLNLYLRIVLRVLFEEFHLIAIDTTTSIDGVEEDLNPSR
jgi:hypothetical protein